MTDTNGLGFYFGIIQLFKKYSLHPLYTNLSFFFFAEVFLKETCDLILKGVFFNVTSFTTVDLPRHSLETKWVSPCGLRLLA